MANHQYFQLMDIDELKRACPNINFDNCQVVVDNSPVIQLGSQEQLVINDGSIIYQQPHHNQMAQQQYIIHEDDIQSDGSFSSHAGQIFFATDSIDMNQQQINEVQHNLQAALIEPSQHMQTETVQQQMVMHYQPALAAAQSQQIIVEHPSPSTSQALQQHHVIISPPQQQTMHQSQPIIISQSQSIGRPPYTVYSHTQQKRVFQQNVQLPPQQRVLQVGQTIQKAIPKIAQPTPAIQPFVQAVQPNPIRGTRPKTPSNVQLAPRMVNQTAVRQLNPGLMRTNNVPQQTQRVVQNIRPQTSQYRQPSPQPQQRSATITAPILQGIGIVNARMPTPNAPSVAITKKAIAVQQRPPQNNTKSETKTSGTSTDLNELDDLENSITAAKIHKTPPEPPSPITLPQNVAQNQYIVQSSQSNQKPNCSTQGPANTQQIQQPYFHNVAMDDSQKVVTLRSGETMPLTEYKRKLLDGQFMIPQNSNQPAASGQVSGKGNNTRGRGGTRGGRGSNVRKQGRWQAADQQMMQQMAVDASHQIVTGDPMESPARMLVVMQSGEQRLITFTLPRQDCTMKELLYQVDVVCDESTKIGCLTKPSISIDYLITVGVTCAGPPSEIIAAAEKTIQLKQQMELELRRQMAIKLQQQAEEERQIQQQLFEEEQQQILQQQFIQQQNTANTSSQGVDTQQIPVTKQKSSEKSRSPPPKIVPGYLAVCPNCGLCSIDHNRCQRCKTLFKGEVRVIASAGTDQITVPKQKTIPVPALGTIDKQKIELVHKKNQISIAEMKNTFAGRGRGAMTAARGRGRPKQKVEEPVILTLISDDEDDDIKTEKLTYNEPKLEDINAGPPQDFVRKKVTDYQNAVDKISTAFAVKTIRIGSYRFEPKEKVIFSSIGMRIIAPNTKKENDNVILDIQKSEIVRIACHLNSPLHILFIWTSRSCGMFVRDSLDMSKTGENFCFDPSSANEHNKRIILQADNLTEEAKATIKSIFSYDIIDEISQHDAMKLLEKSSRCNKTVKYESNAANSSGVRKILIYPPPPQTRGISINTEDYECLAVDQYLNDVIIDFYLRYLLEKQLTEEQRSRTHIFSQFFYKRLTDKRPKRIQNDKNANLTAQQRRHAKVANWTKNVNIFEKDYVIIPINEQQHWYLVIICFPHLYGPVTYDSLIPVKIINSKFVKSKGDRKNIPLQIGNTTITPVTKRDQEAIYLGDDSEKDEASGEDSDLLTSEEEIEVDPSSQNIKQPCILIFDSLAGTSRTRVVATLREYLTCEYNLKVCGTNNRIFTKENIPNYTLKVPQQNNFTDCGLFLLQYVEQFFADPIRDYRLPSINKQVTNWFDVIVVTRKREEISNLLKQLVEEHSPDNLPLPDIALPTLNGDIIEAEDTYNEAEEMGEFEEEELEEEECDDGISTVVSVPEKQNGTRIILRRSNDDTFEQVAKKKPKLDTFDELKNSS